MSSTESLTISDPFRTPAPRPYLSAATRPGGGGGPEQEQEQGEAPGTGWLEGWAESWDEDDPEPVAAPQPAAPTVPQVGGAPAVPPTRRIASFAPIRAGAGRHRLSASVRRRPGPFAVGLLVAATTLALGSLHSPQLPFCGHATAGTPVRVQVRS